MKKLFQLLVVVLPIALIAQRPANQTTVKITGRVVDEASGAPLEYATLILQNARTPDQVTGGITNFDGTFEIETTPGLFNISVEYLTYQTYRKEGQRIQANTDLGIIALSVDVAQLEEVEVIADRTTVELRLDKKIYNVGKDLTVRGGTFRSGRC